MPAAHSSLDAAVILNKHINLSFGLYHHCHGWLAAVGPVTTVLLTALKMTGPASELTWHPHHTRYSDIYGSVSDCSFPQYEIQYLFSAKYIHPQYLPFCTAAMLNAHD
jgi:hypothetical protein